MEEKMKKTLKQKLDWILWILGIAALVLIIYGIIKLIA